MLTEKQNAVLRFISEQIEARGFPPSNREIQDHFGFASQNAARNHLLALEQKGAITREKRCSRGIRLTVQKIEATV